MRQKIMFIAIFAFAIATFGTFGALQAQAAKVGTVTPWDGVNLRTGAGTNNKIIKALPKNTKITILSEENGWANAQLANGTTGWVCLQYIFVEEISDETGTTASENTIDWDNLSDRTSATADRIIEYAKQFIGTKYVYGGSSPSGFDCSGFMYYIFRQNGISIPRTATQQYASGVPVEKSQLIKGDLVFFGTSLKKITHVGMYIGDDQFIHARSTGRPLAINVLSTYSNHYVGAARIIR